MSLEDEVEALERRRIVGSAAQARVRAGQGRARARRHRSAARLQDPQVRPGGKLTMKLETRRWRQSGVAQLLWHSPIATYERPSRASRPGSPTARFAERDRRAPRRVRGHRRPAAAHVDSRGRRARSRDRSRERSPLGVSASSTCGATCGLPNRRGAAQRCSRPTSSRSPPTTSWTCGGRSSSTAGCAGGAGSRRARRRVVARAPTTRSASDPSADPVLKRP